MDSVDFFITASQLKGQNELAEKLKEFCIVQTPKKHLPAFCSGFEFFAELYINVSLEDFVKNVVITGLAWDGTKTALVKILSMRKKHRDGFSDLKVQSVAVQSCFIKNRSWR